MNLLAAMVVCLGIALQALLALLGERRFADQDRLPVHWGSRGTVNAYAPRSFALAIFPVIGIVTVTALAWAGKPVALLALLVLGFAAGTQVYFRAAAKVLREE